MKWKLFGLLMIFFIGSIAAQNRKGAKRIETMKIAFITQELDLTTNEAETFWPIYNSHNEELKMINKSRTKNSNINNMSEEEAAQMIQNKLENEAKKLELRRNYIDQLGSVISQVKIAKLMVAENKFKREVLKRANKRKAKKK